MSAASTYREYVTDRSFMTQYSAYQRKYAVQPRESDKRMLQVIAELAGGPTARGGRPALLDIGCSTGNFLRHARETLPHFDLVGGDAATAVIEQCRLDKELAGIDFLVCDMLNLHGIGQYDFIVANAVTYLFDDREYVQCLRSVQRALKPGGWYLSFEWVHPFHQELRIVETSTSHPDGLPIHARSIHKVRRVFTECGYQQIAAEPFEIPIDLSCPGEADGFESISTRTIKTAEGKRLMFRGALYQPWSHLRAQKV